MRVRQGGVLRTTGCALAAARRAHGPIQARAPWARGPLFLLLLLLLWASGVAPAHAQTIDDIGLLSQGGERGANTPGQGRVVRLRFNATVRFVDQRPAVNAAPSDRYVIRFDLLNADDTVLRQNVDEFRSLPASAGVPAMAFAYTPALGRRTRELSLKLEAPLALRVRQGPDSRSLEIVLPLVAAVPAAAVVPVASTPLPAATASAGVSPSAPPTPDPRPATAPVSAAPTDTLAALDPQQLEIENTAADKLRRAQALLQATGPVDEALSLLHEILKLPPNRQSQTAQELIGQVWERAGSPVRAKAEYELYLRLYPGSDGVARVTNKLAAMGAGPGAGIAQGQPQTGNTPANAADAGPAGAAAASNTAPKAFSGSIAQYYYGGKAKSRSLVNIASGIDQATLSRSTESSLVTSLDLAAQVPVDEGSEGRAVVRGTGAKNLLKGGHSSSSISSAYFDYRRGGFDGLALRVGRQSPISGGLLGLFDGVSVMVPLAPGLKFDLMGGVPANTLVSAAREHLVAAVLEVDGLVERFGGSVYVMNQSTEGITNRQALGGELRYAGERWSLSSLLDYELKFKALNALSLHGSMQLANDLTLTALVDERRAPMLQLTDALISTGATSLRTLLEQRSRAELQDIARGTSAKARQFMLSLSYTLDRQWQASTDLRYSAIGALPAVGDFEAAPATGGQFTWSAQAVGTNLYSKHDINNFGVSITRTPNFKGMQFSYNNLGAFGEGGIVTVEPSIRLYTQSGNDDAKLTRWGPALRGTYKFSRRASLMAEVLLESSRGQGAQGNSDNTQSSFFYVGYRYELF
jgi:hypothetical protein